MCLDFFNFFFSKNWSLLVKFCKKKSCSTRVVLDFEWGEQKLKKKSEKKNFFLNPKMLFHYFFFLSISRVGSFCLFKNSILARKNKTWPPNFENIEKCQFFFKKNHNSSTKIGYTFDEQNVKNERFYKFLILPIYLEIVPKIGSFF